MGMSIYAASNLRKVEKDEVPYCDEDGEYTAANERRMENWTDVFEDDFPAFHTDLEFAYYSETAESECTGFDAPGFHYDWWINQLSIFAFGVRPSDIANILKQYFNKPFVELILMRGGPGTMGPSLCAKLLQDFAEHEEAARAYSEGIVEFPFYSPDMPEGEVRDGLTKIYGAKWYEWYAVFKRGLELGSKNGMVQFT